MSNRGTVSGVYRILDGSGANATTAPLAWWDMTLGGGAFTYDGFVR